MKEKPEIVWKADLQKKQKVWYNKNNVNAGKYRKMNTGRLLLWNRNIQ